MDTRIYWNKLLKSYLVRVYKNNFIDCSNIINIKDYESNNIIGENEIANKTICEIYKISQNNNNKNLTFCRLLYLKYKFNDGDKVNGKEYNNKIRNIDSEFDMFVHNLNLNQCFKNESPPNLSSNENWGISSDSMNGGKKIKKSKRSRKTRRRSRKPRRR